MLLRSHSQRGLLLAGQENADKVVAKAVKLGAAP
jgi:hypothetical protein